MKEAQEDVTEIELCELPSAILKAIVEFIYTVHTPMLPHVISTPDPEDGRTRSMTCLKTW